MASKRRNRKKSGSPPHKAGVTAQAQTQEEAKREAPEADGAEEAAAPLQEAPEPAPPEAPEGERAPEADGPEAAAPETQEAAPPETPGQPEAPAQPEVSAQPAQKQPQAEEPQRPETADAREAEAFALPPEPFTLPDAPKTLQAGPDKDKKKKKRRRRRRRRKRHILFWLFMVLTLCIAGGSVSYIYWMLGGENSPLLNVRADVTLPNVVGLTWDSVKDDEAYGNFVLEMVEVFDDEAPVGQIVDQNPRAPREVKEHSRIIVKVSKGVETVVVPNLVGWNRATALEKLRSMGLTLMVRPEKGDGVPEDSVIRTVPEGGTLVKADTTVTLYVCRESQMEISLTTVPTCIGAESVAQAGVRLTQRGLLVRTVEREDAAPAGTIIGQSPEAGSMVTRSSVVTLIVSTGPPPAPPAPVEEPEPERPSIGARPVPTPDPTPDPDPGESTEPDPAEPVVPDPETPEPEPSGQETP